MPISRGDFRCYDPVLLKKVAQIFNQADVVIMLALESGADLTAREYRPIEEESQILTLVNEFGRDAVLAALHDVTLIRRETFEKVFGGVRRKLSPI